MDYLDHKLTLFGNNLRHFLTSMLYKNALLYTLFFSLLANAFVYFNLYPQHDSVNHMFEFAGTWEISLGRFFLTAYGLFQGQVTSPWIIGILSIIYISLIVYIICDLFQFDRTWQVADISAVFSANLCITELASVYLYVLAAYCLSVLFSCIAVHLLIRKKSPARYVLSTVCFVLSLGLYQAEIAFAITLLAVIAITDLLKPCNLPQFFFKYLKIALTLACSAIIYCFIYKMLLFIFHLEAPNTYSNISRIAQITLEELCISVKGCYQSFFDYFWRKNTFTGVPVTQVSNILLTLIGFISLLVHFFKNKRSWITHALALLILVALPILICLVDILMVNFQLVYHRLYSLCLVYVLLLYIINYFTKVQFKYPAILYSIVITCFCLITLQNIIFSNQVYSNQKIMYDRATSIVGRILDDVESMPDYDAGETEVVLIGELQKNPLVKNLTRINNNLPPDIQKNLGLRKMLNHSRVRGGKTLSVTYAMTFDSFAWLLGSEVYRVSDEEILSEYASLDAVMNMPAYPKTGYCQIVNNRMVIKLS